ncbi:MAG TPA: hydroxyacylglutathione hydrolase [Candidatus Sulfomarinibacteraceae bacterium]|nr:hydroxyacylglutathione hydrolase [Candidatus Sulfomarinibacteraceae bacterium]
MLTVWPIPVFADNYVWVLEREGWRRVVVVDPGDAEPVLAALSRRKLEVAAVLVTHHHRDHTGGVVEVADRFAAPVHGPAREPVPGLTAGVADGDRVELDDLELDLRVAEVPGHTAGHVAYLAPAFALVGDTLFAGGCGRVFEGTFEQMHASLQRLAGQPPATSVYCAHEYTVANLRFALAVEPGNRAISERLAAARAATTAGQATVPSRLADELATNPFLRCSEPEVVAAAEARAGRALNPGAEVFEVLRTWKDGFSA